MTDQNHPPSAAKPPPYPGDQAYPPPPNQAQTQPQTQAAYPPPPLGPQGYPPPAQQADPGYASYGMPVRRPGTVTAAAWITIVLASLGTLFCLLVGGLGLAVQDDFVEGMADSSGLTISEARDIATVMGVMGILGAVVCFVSIITAALSLGQRNWARIITVVIAGGWSLLGLANLAMGEPAGILTLGLGITVIVMYFVGSANAWYSAKNQPTWV